MAQIKILPPEVAHKIAAGEVIERPASVVKELVENSIDAQAAQINIEIVKGGIELIRVQDDGVGISEKDLQLAFQPHATSKISSADDLFALQSLGFRGEALPSMAGVAKVVLYSRPAEQDSGFGIRKIGNEFVVEPAGTPPGTTVEVKELFYNVPARLKFLKSVSAERRRIVETVSKMALAHSHVSFRLVSEGKTILATPGSGRLLDAILIVEGKNILPELVRFQSEFAWGRVFGYLGLPSLAKGNRSGQTYIMNGRLVQNRTMRAALEKAYSGLLPTRTFPWAVLILDLNPRLVDCNVHPAKAEVRFANEQSIFSDLLQAARSGLNKANLAPALQKRAKSRSVKPAAGTGSQSLLHWQPETWEHMDRVLREYRPRRASEAAGAFPTVRGVQESVQRFQEAGGALSPEDVRKQLLNGRIIGQLHQTYILLEVPGGLWLLDQHIVHERILLEQLQEAWEKSQLHIQEIIPQALEFTPAEAGLVEKSLPHLAEFGLELDGFGDNTFLLRAVPSLLAESAGNWKEEILEIARTAKKTTAAKEKALITLACRGAVKAGEHLDHKMIRALLNELAGTEQLFTCPHGRPIIVRLEHRELLRRFGRL